MNGNNLSKLPSLMICRCEICDHTVGVTGWGTLWHISDGDLPATEILYSSFAYCPYCGAKLVSADDPEVK